MSGINAGSAHTHAAGQIAGKPGASSPDYSVLAGTPLFRGILAEDISTMLACLDARRRTFDQGEFVLREGDQVRAIGLVLEGSVRIERTDAWGTRSIMARASFGETFAEAYACIPGATLGVDVVAAEPCCVLFMDTRRVLRTCPSSCSFHSRLIENLLGALASKNLKLSRKIVDITPRTIRERVLSYLSAQSRQAGSRSFTIPFDRQQLADYLCVERSALCHELAKMRREGIIDYHKASFRLNGQAGTGEH